MPQAKPPKSIKVGYKDYKIQEIETFRSSQQLGECDNQMCLIQYRNAGEGENANTLLHEVMHGCFYVYGLCEVFDNNTEERIVNTLTNAIFGVLKDNPKFLQYIKESL